MDHTFKIITKEIQINLNDQINIWFWGDVHYDIDACDRDRFDWFLKKSLSTNSYYFGMGDYHDFASSKEQSVLEKADLHETTIKSFDHLIEKRNREFALKIGQMRGRMLGFLGGNHSWKLQNGKFADEDLAERMGTEYSGWLCVYALHFKFNKDDDKKSRYIYIVACHGRAAGKLIGTSINGVNDLKTIFPFADIYAMGHDHQRGAWPTSTLIPLIGNKSLRMKEHRQYLVRSGSFLKSYQPDESQYTTARLLRPADLGAVKMTISFHRDNKHGEDNIVTDIESTV